MTYWIETELPVRLAIAARPRAGDWLEDEIARWRNEGVTTIVSLLEDHEIADLELEGEQPGCVAAGMTFLRLPIPDRGTPDPTVAVRFARALRGRLEAGEAIVVHCRAGIGRSSLIAASALIAAGLKPEAAIEAIKTARGLVVPDTDEQHRWILNFEA